MELEESLNHLADFEPGDNHTKALVCGRSTLLSRIMIPYPSTNVNIARLPIVTREDSTAKCQKRETGSDFSPDTPFRSHRFEANLASR